MRTTRKSLVSALLTTAFAVSLAMAPSACKKPEDAVEVPEEASFDSVPTLPARRLLTDVEGRTLKADILKRNKGTITILRISDSKVFDLPINRLSERDQEFVNRIPLSEPARKPKETHAYITNRQASIDKLAEQIRLLELESEGMEPESMPWRNLRKQIDSLNKEMNKLNLDIEKYKLDKGL